MPTLKSIPPHPGLRDLVSAYWFVEDMAGAHEGKPIRTCPHPGAVLSLTLGRPNAMVGGRVAPRLAYLGLQTEAREWRSWDQTYFVMIMLTLPGVARFLPEEGMATRDRLIDMAAIIGGKASRRILTDVDAAWLPDRIALRLDAWLMSWRDRTRPPGELQSLVAAMCALRDTGSVTEAAGAAGVSRRQLARWASKHFGAGAKTIADIHRLQDSLRSRQTDQGDPLCGYSDQAHQIRAWRRRLGVTPGRYRELSPMATTFVRSVADAPAFYL